MPLTARSVRWPPLRLAKAESLAPASPRNYRSDRLTTSGSRTCRTLPPLPVIDSCKVPYNPDAVAPQVRFDERRWETERWPLGPKLPRPSSTLPGPTELGLAAGYLLLSVVSTMAASMMRSEGKW